MRGDTGPIGRWGTVLEKEDDERKGSGKRRKIELLRRGREMGERR